MCCAEYCKEWDNFTGAYLVNIEKKNAVLFVAEGFEENDTSSGILWERYSERYSEKMS